MRQVRTCDFCGDDAAGVYEPLPPSIPDAPRMILCDACRDRLSSVVDPLLARIEGVPDADAGDPSASPAGDRDATTAYRNLDDGATGPDSGRARGDDLEAREWPADPRERAEEGHTSTGGALDAADEAASSTDETRSGAGEAGEPTDKPTDGAAGAGGEANLSGDPASRDAGDPSDETDAPPSSSADPADGVEVSESRDASGRPQRERGGAPRGYRKVLRFLENRELPVDRKEAERLAAEAYELDVGEVGAAIDHAVQYGRLREVSGELRR